MKTRIIKTQIHIDETMFSLTPDVRSICKYLYSNGHIDLITIYKIPVQLIQLETGYDISIIKLALDILKDKNILDHYNYLWVNLLRSDYASLEYSGNTNKTAKIKYINTIPKDVIEYFNYSSIDTTIDTTIHTNDKSKIINNKLKTKNKKEEIIINKPLFIEFWSIYPKRRVDKEKCEKKFLSFPEDIQNKIIQDVKLRKEKDEKWSNGFVPMTSTYLNNKKWEDDLEEKTYVFGYDPNQEK